MEIRQVNRIRYLVHPFFYNANPQLGSRKKLVETPKMQAWLDVIEEAVRDAGQLLLMSPANFPYEVILQGNAGIVGMARQLRRDGAARNDGVSMQLELMSSAALALHERFYVARNLGAEVVEDLTVKGFRFADGLSVDAMGEITTSCVLDYGLGLAGLLGVPLSRLTVDCRRSCSLDGWGLRPSDVHRQRITLEMAGGPQRYSAGDIEEFTDRLFRDAILENYITER